MLLRLFGLILVSLVLYIKQSKEQLTRRIVRACRNPHVDAIAHLTGRLWGTRDSYELDFEEVFKVASDTNTYLEINSFPDRLDLYDSLIRLAKEKGIRFVISTDSHALEHLDYMKFGLAMARRG